MAITNVNQLFKQKRWRWYNCKPLAVIALVGWVGVWYFGIIHWAGR